MENTPKVWQHYSAAFKELLSLQYSPVAVRCVNGPSGFPADKKVRICRAILEAGRGQTLAVDKSNNACFGAAWHLGFRRIRDERVAQMVRKFVVEGEKLFCSYQALDNLLFGLEDPPDNSGSHFLLSPMENAQEEPALVVFICNAEQACRLLTLAIFQDGRMPSIKIGGPTCRMSLVYPMQSGEVNLSFYDYTARRICNVEQDKLLISLPYGKVPAMFENIEKCSAGKAKISFPAEFRQFLQRRMNGSEAS